MHDLSWDELGNGESDYLDRPVDIAEHPLHVNTRQPFWFGAEAQHELVAVDRVNVKVDGDARAACSSQPIQQPPARVSKVVGAERCEPPGSDVVVIIVGPRVQADKGHSVR